MWIFFRILSLKTKDASASSWLFDFVSYFLARYKNENNHSLFYTTIQRTALYVLTPLYSHWNNTTCVRSQGAILWEYRYILWVRSTKCVPRCTYQIKKQRVTCYVAVVILMIAVVSDPYGLMISVTFMTSSFPKWWQWRHPHMPPQRFSGSWPPIF